MRMRASLRALMLVLACGAGAFGCQIVAGLTVLQISGGEGGQDGQGSSECADGAPKGTPCGGTCSNDMFLPPGTCDGSGKCSSQTATSCAAHFGCSGDGKTCSTTCTRDTGCSETGFCTKKPMGMGMDMDTGMCVACGIFPPNAACPMPPNDCDTCNSDKLCIAACNPTKCNGDKTVNSGVGPARLDCGAQCNKIMVSCLGPYPCEVVCESGGCKNLILDCGPDSSCKLTCNGDSCSGATITCGGNKCEATCPSGSSSVVNQVCNGSCGCKKTGCQ